MKLIQWNEKDAYYNLAAEEYVFQQMIGEEFFLLWQNQNAVVVGRHQNTIEEINADFVREHEVQVVRRMSGGGAVYHDLGNLNFSIILNAEGRMFNFGDLSVPIMESLGKMGIHTEFTGRNDLTLNGKKISGTAQSIKKGRLLHHGTLLFHSNLDTISDVLRVKADKIESKGIKSVRSRVTNICDHFPNVTIEDFKVQFFKDMQADRGVERCEFSEADKKAIRELREERYVNWDWNYGRSPEYNIKKERHFEGGNLSIYLDVKKGIIQTARIYGDYFGDGEIAQVEESLQEVSICEEDVKRALQGFDIDHYIHGITIDELTAFIVY